MEGKTDFPYGDCQHRDIDRRGGCPILGGREGQTHGVDGHEVLDALSWRTTCSRMQRDLGGFAGAMRVWITDMKRTVQGRDRLSPWQVAARIWCGLIKDFRVRNQIFEASYEKVINSIDVTDCDLDRRRP